MYVIAHFLLRGVGMKPAFPGQTIPASAFMIFQAMFAAITPGICLHALINCSPPLTKLMFSVSNTALAFGSAAERMSVSY